MRRIEAIPNEASPLAEQARALFRLYYEFLVSTKSCGAHLPRLDDEIATLPTPYTSNGGEVLLALVDNLPAGCIAYRATEDPRTCDIKRLFVHPTYRDHSLSRVLIADVLHRAKARNFTRAILDTDTTTMPAAHALYLALGFKEYIRQDNLTYLELPL